LRALVEGITGDVIGVEGIERIRSQVETTLRHLQLLAGRAPAAVRAPVHQLRARGTPARAAAGDGGVLDALPVEVVEGDHYSMLAEPQVASLGQAILAHCKATL